jgi:hypothetical protein
MTRFLLAYLGAALAVAFVIDRWLRRGEPEPPAWNEPEDGWPAWDGYQGGLLQ